MANEMFSAESRMDMGLTRDQTMAENVFWIREQLPESKMIVWAHNVHIATSEFTMSLEEGSIKGMGSIMKDELGDDMVSIGAAFNQGFFEEGQRTPQPASSNTIDAALSMAGFEYAIFDLHAEAGDEIINEWLNSPHVLQAQDFEMTCVPIEAYDAFYFTESISKTRLNQSSVARLGNMR
jgi:erythromycin esterase-like protein